MDEIIEKDALTNTPDAPDPSDTHVHEDVKSIVMTPRMDQTIIEKMRTWFRDEMKPGIHIVHKENDPLRYMFLITSNSYQDRENETITTKALEEYEASCYPGDGLYHNDNPFLWWHDDDVVMGEIVAVNVSGPFLVEVAKELPTGVSRVLWDFAEQNGDKAGTSHRFGYLAKDRDPNGVFQRIFKQETSYLPERDLAANDRTYAGVIMATPQSDARLDKIFQEIGIPDASKKLHAKTGELEKELSALGIQHKATKPPFPPKPQGDPADPAILPDPEEGEGDEEAKEDVGGRAMTMDEMMVTLNTIMGLVAQLTDAQGLMPDMAKAIKDLEDKLVTQDTAEKAAKETVEQTLTALKARIDAQEKEIATLRKQMGQTSKSVQNEKGQDPAALETSTNALAQTLKHITTGEKQIHPIFGVEYDPSRIPTYDKK